jgi:hypothetical protein
MWVALVCGWETEWPPLINGSFVFLFWSFLRPFDVLSSSITVYIMDYGTANIRFNEFQQSVLKYNSQRIPGTAYTFKKSFGDSYQCLSCIQLGQRRTITVKNGRIVARKNPEDGHHLNCIPITEDTRLNRFFNFYLFIKKVYQPQPSTAHATPQATPGPMSRSR